MKTRTTRRESYSTIRSKTSIVCMYPLLPVSTYRCKSIRLEGRRTKHHQFSETTRQSTRNVLSDRVVQELVTSQVALQPPDIQAIRIGQAVEPRELDVKPDFISNVLRRVAIHGLDDGLCVRARRRCRLRRLFLAQCPMCRYLRRLATHENVFEHPTAEGLVLR